MVVIWYFSVFRCFGQVILIVKINSTSCPPDWGLFITKLIHFKNDCLNKKILGRNIMCFIALIYISYIRFNNLVTKFKILWISKIIVYVHIPYTIILMLKSLPWRCRTKVPLNTYLSKYTLLQLSTIVFVETKSYPIPNYVYDLSWPWTDQSALTSPRPHTSVGCQTCLYSKIIGIRCL